MDLTGLSSLGFNWLDFVILLALLFYSIEGYSIGFTQALLDLVSFISSFIIGLKSYSFIGDQLSKIFSIPIGWSHAIGFLIAALVSEMLIGIFLRKVTRSLSISKLKMEGTFLKSADRILGVIFSIFSGLVLVSFLLTVIVALPVSVFLKHSVSSSKIGNILIAKTQGFEKDLSSVFGGAINESLNFLTVEPKGNETLNLKFKTNKFSIDSNAQQQMFVMVNRERNLQGMRTLEFNNQLTKAGEAHCEDMFARGYFSHYTPEGLSPFDRMAQRDIQFVYAGENLALAPNVTLAMQGLMQSEGHRANILSNNFGKIGIGAIDGGVYGEMFCQEFTD